jgi:hypothetical protein
MATSWRGQTTNNAAYEFFWSRGCYPDQLTSLRKALKTWNDLHPAQVKAQTVAEWARQAKDAARVASEYDALRWVSTRGEKGPWSEVAAATVAV